ncbi:MAG: restriction endonuclease subunit S [Azonexus sp.]|nr:restriction endonuclease subunit S [Azonexus sp.]MCK6410860.1 restriction endonuclease subunit S [Azonexus sp.]
MSDIPLNPDELPSTWVLTNLGAVVNYGRTEKAEPSQISGEDWVLELEDIEKDSSKLLQRMTFSERQSKSTKNRFQAGDILYGKLRPYLNKVLIADQPGYCTTEIVPIEAGAQLDSRYLFYWLKHPAFLKYVEAESHGMNMPRLGTDSAKAAPFVLAPRNEQTRIADQLDQLLARIQSCNDRLDAIPALLKRFRQAVLSAAVSGRLTDDWRDEDGSLKQTQTNGLWTIPAGWRWATAENECGFITKGTTPSKEKMRCGSGEVPYIKVYNLGFNGKLDFTIDPTFVESRTHAEELKRSIALPGDVLMNIVGPPLGKVSVVPETHPEWNINQAIARFRPGPNLHSAYLASCLLSTGLVEHAISKSKATAGQWNLTLEVCRALPVPIPPLAEQDEIIRRLQRFMLMADRIEARHAAARTQAQRLSPLLLAKAFRGELVPQDPNDESASVLLERINKPGATVTESKVRLSQNPKR